MEGSSIEMPSKAMYAALHRYVCFKRHLMCGSTVTLSIVTPDFPFPPSKLRTLSHQPPIGARITGALNSSYFLSLADPKPSVPISLNKKMKTEHPQIIALAKRKHTFTFLTAACKNFQPWSPGLQAEINVGKTSIRGGGGCGQKSEFSRSHLQIAGFAICSLLLYDDSNKCYVFSIFE